MVKREVKEIIVHCSAGPASQTVSQIRDYHVKVKGYKDIGYHFVVTMDGGIRCGRDKDIAGAHCEGHNQGSLGICLIGGLQQSGKMIRFTKEQFEGLKILIEGIFLSYGRLPVVGHHTYNKGKSCPNFKVEAWIADGMPPAPSKYITTTGD